jgi:hypothetical protein
MEAPEQPHQHHAHTGHRWLDVVLAFCAMFVSVVSLVVAIGHGKTMERMADANTRMVEANSWPFVEFSTHNVGQQGNAEVRLVMTNQGIGPARIQTFEMWYNGQPLTSPLELLKACCQTNPAERAQASKTTIAVGAAAPSILRAGDHTNFFGVLETKENKDLWEKFNVERGKIAVRVCYCSVFDECWIGSGTTTQADRVASCPVPAVPFHVTN